MYARVASWDGAEAEGLRQASEEIAKRVEEGPPEGVPSVGFLLLVDPDNGRTLAVSLFETEDDMRTGHETLETMSPPGDGFGTRKAVEFYEVAADARV